MVPSVVAAVAVLAVGALGALAMSFGVGYSMPDNVHTVYGFPLAWGSHTTDSFIGPVDKWTVDIASLVLDLAAWFGVAALAVAAVGALRRRWTGLAS
jgi:hypothetical protein